VVTVRNTDINAFMKYRPDLAGVMKRVVAQADRITFLSPAYVPRLLERLDFRVHQSVLRKIEIVPNGIDSHWLSTELIPPPPKNCWRIICVQDGRSNKNVRGLVAAASLLANSHPVILTIVGSHPRRSELARHARGLRIECVGVVHQWEELAHLYQRHHVYAMPSFHESFGLVYLEALSQGLPILHSRGEGPAGLFLDASICAQVDPWLPADISAGLAGLLSRDQLRRQECRDCVQKFTWPEVASRYADIYQQVASETGG
jgi:glycosyltransferase involved in cell wall biosynthesis